MSEHNEIQRSEPRSEAEIFEDLRALALSDGALHDISSLIYRDFIVTVDRRDGRVIDDPDRRWSLSKLNKNEMLLLLGLMVQSPTECTYTIELGREGFAAYVLMRSFVNFMIDLHSMLFQLSTRKHLFSLSGRIPSAYSGKRLSTTVPQTSTTISSSTSAVSAI